MSAALSEIDLLRPAAAWPRPRLLPAPDCEPTPSTGPDEQRPRPQRHTQLRLTVPGLPDPPAEDRVDGRADPDAFAYRMCQGVLDVVAGRRPTQQLMRWLRPDVYDTLRRRAGAAATGSAARWVVVRSVRTCRVHEDAVEVSAVAVDGRRARALAMRLDGVGSRWRVTALVIG